MSKKKMQKIDLDNFFIRSEEPDQELQEELAFTPANENQKLFVRKEKKGRAGKVVTVVEGFEGSYEALVELSKQIKQHCGTGGSAKHEQIIIQGDLADKIVRFLASRGYSAKKTTM